MSTYSVRSDGRYLGLIVGVVGAPAGLAALDGDAEFGVPSRYIGGYVEEEEFVAGQAGRLSGALQAGAGPTTSLLNGPIQLRESLGLEYGGVGVFFGTLADSGRGVVDLCPAAHGVMGGKAKGVPEGVVATGEA